MQDCHGYYLFILGVLIGILQGVCVVLSDTKTVYLETGSSLDLTLKYPKDSVSSVQWIFNEKKFAGYSQSQSYSYQKSQFIGRLQKDDVRVGVTVQRLQPQDSGNFSMVVDGTVTQYLTQTFTVYILDPVTAVHINKTEIWIKSTNSCDVDVKCAALGAERVSYMWSGYKTGSGAQLQFSLSPAEGAVTLICTADNNISSSSASETLRCNTEHLKTDVQTGGIPFLWLVTAGAAAFFLLIALVVLIYWWRSHRGGNVEMNATTVYEDVSPGPITQNNKRSDSIINAMTVYETVDDLRMTSEMTIYAKVTLPQHGKVRDASSSPYQQVC